MSGIKRPNCPRCIVRNGEWYEFTFNDGSVMAWNVSRAIDLVLNSALPLEERNRGVVPVEIVKEIVRNNDLVPGHMEHVDPSIPGLAVVVEHEGQRLNLLIDGNHRAARCLRDGLPFFVFCLTEEEECSVRMDPRELVAQQRAMQVQEFILDILSGGETDA